jgi:hypothetical protein
VPSGVIPGASPVLPTTVTAERLSDLNGKVENKRLVRHRSKLLLSEGDRIRSGDYARLLSRPCGRTRWLCPRRLTSRRSGQSCMERIVLVRFQQFIERRLVLLTLERDVSFQVGKELRPLGIVPTMSTRLKMWCSMPCLAWVGTKLGTIHS